MSTVTSGAAVRAEPSRGRATDRAVPWLDRPVWHMLRLDPIGLGLGVALALVSCTPSLLPRTALFQGLASGISAGIGYGIGVALTWVVLRAERFDHASERYRRVAPAWALRRGPWWALIVVSPIGVGIMLGAGLHWQRRLAGLMDTPPPDAAWLWAGPIMVAVFAVLLSIARGVRLLATIAARLLRSRGHLPRALAALVGTVVVLVVLLVVVDQVVLRGTLTVVDDAFSGLNAQTYPGDAPPSSPARSGSPTSLVGWATLGREGRAFVSHSRSPAELAAASGHAPADPVRAYVGLASAPDPRDRARLAVAELDRAGAFSRRVVMVATTTGTGWIDEPSADALELAYGGDTAIVATQYSFLPSWISFLVDRSRAAAEGRAVFDAVAARIASLPPGRRPLLLAYGESLGSQGSEAAFASLDDARARSDGVLWVGPPNSNRLWSSLVRVREPSSPEIAPIVGGGREVRFGADAADLRRPSALGWDRPRVAYLQHASDPIVWWSPSLLWREPDWLAEPRGRDVSDAVDWHPIVTFWQITIDMTNALGVPDGHGHNYRGEALAGWVAVAPPPGWTDADTTRAQGILGG